MPSPDIMYKAVKAVFDVSSGSCYPSAVAETQPLTACTCDVQAYGSTIDQATGVLSVLYVLQFAFVYAYAHV